MTDIARRLRAVLPADQVDDSELALTVYARDGSFFEYRPQAVVRATSADDVSRVVAVARSAGVPVTFRAGGTSLSGQTVGTGIVVAECDAKPAVALLLHGPYRFEQRADAAPFHIAARRPVEDLLDRVSVLGAEMRIHRFGSL